jgi:hypothetical protein
MKNLFSFLLTTVVASSAFAWPKLNDTATYDAAAHLGAQTAVGTLTLLTTAIDVGGDSMTVQQNTFFNNSSSTGSTSVKLSQMQQFAQELPALIADCAHQGGTAETVATPAGTFNTCKIVDDTADQTGFVWYADVLFGWAKQVHTAKSNGEVTEITLKSFSNGR